MVGTNQDIRPVLADGPLSAQTFIKEVPQPEEMLTYNMTSSQAPPDGPKAGLGAMVWKCVHVNVHLHLVLQNLHQLLHGGQVTRLQL